MEPKAHRHLYSLIHLRWVAGTGQLATILITHYGFHAELPLFPLLILASLTLISNLSISLVVRSNPDSLSKWTGWILAFDTFLLTGLLYWSGGPNNPFSVLYLVHVTLAAVMLNAQWTWFLVFLSIGSFGFLFYTHQELHWLHHSMSDSDGEFSLHLKGMWFAFLLASSLIARFVIQVNRALTEREQELASTRKLASLATLAAGAAHELGTPLATIALAAKEMERNATSRADLSIDDIKLIRSQVVRCRTVLDRLSNEAGQHPGEATRTFLFSDIRNELISKFPKLQNCFLWNIHEPEHTVCLPFNGLTQALGNLIQNALDASPENEKIEITFHRFAGNQWKAIVEDKGSGMSSETIARLGEPFFTTKEPGKGMGLGFFLVRSFVDQVHGNLAIESNLGEGTKITMVLPT